MRKAFRNWLWPGLLRRLAFGPLLDRQVDLRTRAGPALTARLRDLAAPAEVFGLDSYDFKVIDWAQVRYVIDVGAHIGSFTLWVSSRTRARVLAVEPNPQTYELLVENVRRAGLTQLVQVSDRALAGSRGRRRLSVVGSSETARLTTDVDGGVPVEAVTLTDVIRESGFPSVDILKVDVEGAERQVFGRLAPEQLKTVRCVIVECHRNQGTNPGEVVDVLRAAGFRTAVEENAASAVETAVGWR
jgi:FkbM family methyltransferase